MTTRAQAIGSCPDLEQLAAFIDGCLEGDERHQMIDHLNGCADCWEIYTETLRFQEFEADGEDACGDPEEDEEEEEDPRSSAPSAPTAKIIDHPSRWRFWRPAIAAAAMLVIAVPAWRYFATFDFDSAHLVESAVAEDGLAALTTKALTQFQWPTIRGDESKAYRPENELYFQLGVSQVALIAALRTGNLQAAGQSIEEIRLLFAASDSLLQPVFERLYRDLEERLQTAGSEALELVETLRLEAVAIGQQVDLSMDPTTDRLNHPYQLGKWAIAGLIAAETGQQDFFNRKYRRAVNDTLHADPPLVSEEMLEIGRKIESQLKAKEIQLELLASSFRELVRVGGGG